MVIIAFALTLKASLQALKQIESVMTSALERSPLPGSRIRELKEISSRVSEKSNIFQANLADEYGHIICDI